MGYVLLPPLNHWGERLEKKERDESLFEKKRKLHLKEGNQRKIKFSTTGHKVYIYLFSDTYILYKRDVGKVIGKCGRDCEEKLLINL